MADRDPDKIKQDIDMARDQLAGDRGCPRRAGQPAAGIADDVKAGVVRFHEKPAVAVSLAGVGALVLVVVVRRIRR